MKAPDKSKTKPGKLCARGHDDGGGKSLRYLNGGACFTCVQENRSRSRGGKVARAPKAKAKEDEPSSSTIPRTKPARAAKFARPKPAGGLVGIVADLCSGMTLCAFAERMGISTERAIELIVRGLERDSFSGQKGGGDAGGPPTGRTPSVGKGPSATRGQPAGAVGRGAPSSPTPAGSQLRRIYDDLELDDEPMPSPAELDEIEQDEPEPSDDEEPDPAEVGARTRARTIAMKRLTKEELRIGALLWPELEQSCALDLADAGASSLEQVGRTLNVTRERVRQIEVDLFRKLRRRHGDLLRELLASAAELTPGESLGDRMELS